MSDATLVRLTPTWAAVIDRLDTPTMQAILGGPGRVVRVWKNPLDDAPATSDDPAPQVLIRPAQTLWRAELVEERDRPRWVRFLVQPEVNDFAADGYDPGIPIEAAHVEAFRQLNGWAPVVDGMTCAFPIYRAMAPHPTPLWDDKRGKWYTSAEYRFQASNPIED